MRVSNVFRSKIFSPIVAAAIALAPIASAQSQSSEFGTVEVSIAFPSDYTPASKVCAQSTDNYYLLNCVETEDGPPGGTAELSLRPGEYFIFAAVLGQRTAGGDLFTLYHAAPGANSQPVPVSVSAGQRQRQVLLLAMRDYVSEVQSLRTALSHHSK